MKISTRDYNIYKKGSLGYLTLLLIPVLIMLSCAGQTASACETQPPFLYAQQITLDSGEYYVLLSHRDQSNESQVGPNKISFCQAHESKDTIFEEDGIGDSFLSMPILRDVGDFVFTVWVTGVGYRVRVYLLSETGGKKILEAGTYSPPNFLTLKSGNLALLIDTRNRNASESSLVFDIYEFSKTEFTYHKDIKIQLLPEK